jgi:hypothetical protein
VVVRADSIRRDAERVLRAMELDEFVAFMICGDDSFPIAAQGQRIATTDVARLPVEAPMFVRAYSAISARLERLGISPGAAVGLECTSLRVSSFVNDMFIRRIDSLTDANPALPAHLA